MSMPGTGRRHPAARGERGWETSRANKDADDGSGWVFVLTGFGKPLDIRIGLTRKPPIERARVLMRDYLTAQTTNQPAILVCHLADPPQLWAVYCHDRLWVERKTRLLVAEMNESGEKIELRLVLRAMREAAGTDPARVPYL